MYFHVRTVVSATDIDGVPPLDDSELDLIFSGAKFPGLCVNVISVVLVEAEQTVPPVNVTETEGIFDKPF